MYESIRFLLPLPAIHSNHIICLLLWSALFRWMYSDSNIPTARQINKQTNKQTSKRFKNKWQHIKYFYRNCREEKRRNEKRKVTILSFRVATPFTLPLPLILPLSLPLPLPLPSPPFTSPFPLSSPFPLLPLPLTRQREEWSRSQSQPAVRPSAKTKKQKCRSE